MCMPSTTVIKNTTITRTHAILAQDYTGYGLSQWETKLHRNAVSHRLSPYLEWSLLYLVLRLQAGLYNSSTVCIRFLHTSTKMIKCKAKNNVSQACLEQIFSQNCPHTWAHVVQLHGTAQNSHPHLSVHVAQYLLYILLTVTRAAQRVLPCIKAPQPRDHCNMHNGLGADHCTS